jgi:hypothetical protein
MGENYERNITPIRSDISRFSRGTILGLVANEQPLAETIEDLISTGASRSYCLSLFSLATELPNPKFTRYMALAKRAVGLQFSQQVHIFLK